MRALLRDAAAFEPPKPRLGAPDWVVDGRDWPNRAASRFFQAGGMRFHVQIAGQGPVLLLLHGTGAATHSWRDLLPLLSPHYTVVAPDLPGHGFSERPADMTMAGMARAIKALLDQLGLQPQFCAGHSAGAAILCRMCLDGLIAPETIIALNGALLPFGGAHAPIFAPLARLIARSPFVPFMFAFHAADGRVVERLLNGTGSLIDAPGKIFYARLARRSAHAGSALAMMANWDLTGLLKDLPRLKPPLILVVGQNDRAIPPAEAPRIKSMLGNASIISLPGLGHLAHEERPEQAAAIIQEHCA